MTEKEGWSLFVAEDFTLLRQVKATMVEDTWHLSHPDNQTLAKLQPNFFILDRWSLVKMNYWRRVKGLRLVKSHQIVLSKFCQMEKVLKQETCIHFVEEEKMIARISAYYAYTDIKKKNKFCE